MLSYQHIYHAGNFADVQKHALLIQLLKALRIKPARMAALDTHAGRGIYDLSSAEAQKTGEFAQGIAALWQEEPPPAKDFGIVVDYLRMVHQFNEGGQLQRYPGTAAIARRMLRPQDRLICIEKHPGEARELQATFAGDEGTTVLLQDGFAALSEMVPFPERRGVVMVDPSYEIKSEYLDLPRYLEKAWKKWPQGVYFIWYPIMQSLGHRHLLAALRATAVTDVLVSEIRLEQPPQEDYRMYGSGIAIVNAPWPEAVMNDMTQKLVRALPVKAFGDVYWLDNKKIDPSTGMLER